MNGAARMHTAARTGSPEPHAGDRRIDGADCANAGREPVQGIQESGVNSKFML